MTIDNFKGIKHLETNFGVRSFITGANGVGKSTIYDAYMWCLFGVNHFGKEFGVQPLTAANEIVHKVEVHVTLNLEVDGKAFKVERIQREKWSVPRGQFNEIFTGNEQVRIINDTPYSVSEFSKKLCEICDTKNWLMLSSVDAFMNIKVEERRRFLQQLAGGVSDEEIASDFPLVYEALKNGKTIDELQRQNDMSRKTTDNLLQQIPARIDELEKMRVHADGNLVELKLSYEKQRAEYDEMLTEALNSKPQSAPEGLAEELAAVTAKVSEIESNARAKSANYSTSKSAELNTVTMSAMTMTRNIEYKSGVIAKYQSQLQQKMEDHNRLVEKWNGIKAEEFAGNVDNTCPVCGQPFPEDKLEEQKTIAKANFEEDKKKRLELCEIEGKSCSLRIEELKRYIEETENSMAEDKRKLELFEADKVRLQEELKKVPSVEELIHENLEYDELCTKRDALRLRINEYSTGIANVLREYDVRVAGIRDKIRQIDVMLSDVTTKIAEIATNDRIDEKIAELESQKREYVQTIAACDKLAFQIRGFKKKKIFIVEGNVSSLFEIVRWKMFEPNITNDGEKEICQAVIDGIPYEQTNTATRINAGIDIINGITKALDTQVPLFVDNVESVTNLRNTPSQLITLAVTDGQELTIL